MVKRASWLSVTPEPERELPQAVATLRPDAGAGAAAVARERERIERLVLRGSQRRWLAYLHEVVELIDRRAGDGDPDVARARARATAVIANHHNLLLGAARPGRGAAPPATGPPCSVWSPAANGGSEIDDTPTQRKPMSTTIPRRPPDRADRRASSSSSDGPASSSRQVLMPLELEAEERGGALPEETVDGDQARGDRGAAARRAGRRRARRPGLVDGRVVPGQRAVRPRDQRPALARAQRLQRAAAGHARADRALPRCPRCAARAATPTR